MEYNPNNDSYKFKLNSTNFFVNIGFVVTGKCNLKCIQCCERFSNEEGNIINIKKFISKLAKSGLKKICITGGEPLLRKDLNDILAHAHKENLIITFSTNSYLIDKKKLLDLQPYIDNMRVTLYGEEQVHDNITKVKGSFEKVIANLKNAQELKIPVSVITTLMNRNYKEIENVAKICKKYSVKKLYLFSLIPTGRGKDVFKDEYKNPVNLKKEITKLKKQLKIDIKIIDWKIEGQCALLYSNGDVVAQPSFKDEGNKKIVGNLLNETAKSIWKKYPFKKNHLEYYKKLH